MSIPQPLPMAALTLLALSIAPESQADARTFRNPALQGYRLDYCQASGQECGERVATEWCVVQGYEYARDWRIDQNIGGLQPTIRLDNQNVCRDGQCDGFSEITCDREERVFSMPSLGGDTRGTVFTPDRRRVAAAATRIEVQLDIPGCSQFGPAVALCQSVPDYQYCRSLLQEGHVLECRAGLALDRVIADLHEATPGSYELSLRSRASITVNQSSRGAGKIKGESHYRVTIAVPEHAETVETCLQLDRYTYHQSGPLGGAPATYEADDCDEPIEGEFSPHDDDLLYAYDLCEGHGAWGSKIEATTDLIVAGIFRFSSPTAFSIAVDAAAPRSVGSYLAIEAPLEVTCRE